MRDLRLSTKLPERPSYLESLLIEPSVSQIILIGLATFIISFIIIKVTALRVSRRLLLLTIVLALTLTFISVIVFQREDHCGMPVCYKMGWPHFVYITGEDRQIDNLFVGHSIIYLVSNFVFYTSTSFLAFTLLKSFLDTHKIKEEARNNF